MDFELIERLMRMLEQSDLNELDVNEGGMRVRLAKQPASGGLAPLSDAGHEVLEAVLSAPAELFLTTKAGMAGTFYRAPSPGAEPFVEVGSFIREGDPLGIVEAMKMLNPVEAECDGVIIAIHVADGGSVEPGVALFDIEPILP